jgi:hypothetical protein
LKTTNARKCYVAGFVTGRIKQEIANVRTASDIGKAAQPMLIERLELRNLVFLLGAIFHGVFYITGDLTCRAFGLIHFAF